VEALDDPPDHLLDPTHCCFVLRPVHGLRRLSIRRRPDRPLDGTIVSIALGMARSRAGRWHARGIGAGRCSFRSRRPVAREGLPSRRRRPEPRCLTSARARGFLPLRCYIRGLSPP
jgi:hypothetical protein